MKLPVRAQATTAAVACAAAPIAGTMTQVGGGGPAAGSTAAAVARVDAATRAVTTYGPQPDLTYQLGVTLKAGVNSFRVCGWLPDQSWHCTGWYTGYSIAPAPSVFVGNVGGPLRRGKMMVSWNGGGPGRWDVCNTNGPWDGYDYFGSPGYVVLGTGSDPVGQGNPEC